MAAPGACPLRTDFGLGPELLDNRWLAFFVGIVGCLISLTAILLGLLSRRFLSRSYSPRASQVSGSILVKNGPYRWIRHPLYLGPIVVHRLALAYLQCAGKHFYDDPDPAWGV